MGKRGLNGSGKGREGGLERGLVLMSLGAVIVWSVFGATSLLTLAIKWAIKQRFVALIVLMEALTCLMAAGTRNHSPFWKAVFGNVFIDIPLRVLFAE